MRKVGDFYLEDGSVAAGESTVVELATSGPVTIAVDPAEGATATVETTCASLATIREGSPIWTPWASGAVTEATEDSRETPITAVRISAADAAVTYEVAQ